jgi:hypothetical protein
VFKEYVSTPYCYMSFFILLRSTWLTYGFLIAIRVCFGVQVVRGLPKFGVQGTCGYQNLHLFLVAIRDSSINSSKDL